MVDMTEAVFTEEMAPTPAGRAKTEPRQERPLRFLLVRARAGDRSWLVESISYFLAPVEIVQVVGLGNALWRLGHERFDTVLLDLEGASTAAVAYCRSRIADVAAVPVLDLRSDGEEALRQVGSRAEPQRRKTRKAEPPDEPQRALRLPWQRRGRRQLADAEATSTG